MAWSASYWPPSRPARRWGTSSSCCAEGRSPTRSPPGQRQRSSFRATSSSRSCRTTPEFSMLSTPCGCEEASRDATGAGIRVFCGRRRLRGRQLRRRRDAARERASPRVADRSTHPARADRVRAGGRLGHPNGENARRRIDAANAQAVPVQLATDGTQRAPRVRRIDARGERPVGDDRPADKRVQPSGVAFAATGLSGAGRRPVCGCGRRAHRDGGDAQTGRCTRPSAGWRGGAR